jgi:hypothetical protein
MAVGAGMLSERLPSPRLRTSAAQPIERCTFLRLIPIPLLEHQGQPAIAEPSLLTWTRRRPASGDMVDTGMPFNRYQPTELSLRDHKAEYLAAVLEGVLIVLATLSIAHEAWRGLLSPK